MNIQHNKSQTVEDPIAGGIIGVKKFVDMNGKAILTACTAVLAIAAAVLFYSSMNESNNRKAQEIFGVGILDYQTAEQTYQTGQRELATEQYDRALASFVDAAERYKRTPAGRMSAFMAGSILMRQGKFDGAIEWFEIASAGRGTGFVKAQAFEGLATAYEEKGDNASAVRYLERALRDGGAPHRNAAIRWKLTLLNRDNPSIAIEYCEAIIADTLSNAYRQRAENMLAVLKNSWEMGTPPAPKVPEPAPEENDVAVAESAE